MERQGRSSLQSITQIGKLHQKKLVFFSFFAVVLLCIIIVSITATFSFFSCSSNDDQTMVDDDFDFKYAGVVLDMGSSGSRISVFGWDKEHVVQPIPYGGPFYYSAIGIGISKFRDPIEAANSLDSLLNYAERAILSYGVSILFTKTLISSNSLFKS